MKLFIRFRRLHQAAFAVWVLSLVLAVPQVLAQQHSALVVGVDAVGITVSDMDRAVDFYSKVLTFEKVSDTEVAGENYEHLEGVFGLRMRVVRMRLGDEFIELTEYLAPKGRPIPVESRSNDRWFQHIAIIVSDMDHAYARLRQNKVEHASSGPQRLPVWNKNAAGISAFYFKDPDGHPVEILQFPPDKGADKWHHAAGRLFLGIDHTAIVVWDTEASIKFYRDLLGNLGREESSVLNCSGSCHSRRKLCSQSYPPGDGESVWNRAVTPRYRSIREHPVESRTPPRYSASYIPPDGEWLVRVIASNKQFVFGMYRRHTKTISSLGQIDQLFGMSATTRNWNTILAVLRLLKDGEKKGLFGDLSTSDSSRTGKLDC